MAGEVKNYRTTYATEKLPTELAKAVLAKAEEFVTFMEEHGVMTAPEVREMINPMLPQITMLRAQLMAATMGPGEDEMDVWERNGICAKK